MPPTGRGLTESGRPGRQPGTAPRRLPGVPSIAVLPFLGMGGDPAQDYLADSTAEDITTALSRLRWLFVIARSSASTYEGAVRRRPADRE